MSLALFFQISSDIVCLGPFLAEHRERLVAEGSPVIQYAQEEKVQANVATRVGNLEFVAAQLPQLYVSGSGACTCSTIPAPKTPSYPCLCGILG